MYLFSPLFGDFMKIMAKPCLPPVLPTFIPLAGKKIPCHYSVKRQKSDQNPPDILLVGSILHPLDAQQISLSTLTHSFSGLPTCSLNLKPLYKDFQFHTCLLVFQGNISELGCENFKQELKCSKLLDMSCI